MKYLYLTLLVVLTSCSVEPVAINYGSDGCHFCKMIIVDNQHAAQIVTVKGRAFKYDAIECMMNHLSKWDQPNTKFLLIADYDQPGTLIDATQANYLVSDAIPSPMGEFLSGFEDKSVRDEVALAKGGEVLDWNELQDQFLME